AGDCCIPSYWRNEMRAVTPPIISSKEVAQKQATPLIAPATSLTTKNRFTPSFRGWRLDENLKLKSPPYRGEVRRQDKMKLASRLVLPPHAAHAPRRLHPRSRCAAAAAPPFPTVQKSDMGAARSAAY